MSERPECYGDFDSSNEECMKCQEPTKTDCENIVKLRDEAINSFSNGKMQEWFARIGDNASLLGDIGAWLNIYKKYDVAKEILEKAAKLKPEDGDLHNYLAVAYMGLEKSEDAVKEIRKAIEVHPNDASAHYNLGIIYNSNNDLDEALSEFKKAVELGPDEADFHRELGEVYERKNMAKEAAKEYKSFLKLPGALDSRIEIENELREKLADLRDFGKEDLEYVLRKIGEDMNGTIYTPTRNVILENFKAVKDEIVPIWYQTELSDELIINVFNKLRNAKTGAAPAFISNLLFLKDRNKYNIFVPTVWKGLEHFGEFKYDNNISLGQNYLNFNRVANELKQQGLEPQGIDWLLFKTDRLPGINKISNEDFKKIWNEQPLESYLLLRTQPETEWQDKEGKEYHFGSNVPNNLAVVQGARVVFDRNVDGQIVFLGHASVSSVKEEDRGRKTEGNRPIIDKIAFLENYVKFNPPKARSTELEKMIESIPNYNNQHSIRPMTKTIFDQIVGYLAPTVNTLAYYDQSFVENAQRLLFSKRQIILYGPPGTSKTHFAIALAKKLAGSTGYHKLIQFHPSYSYEDFVEGLIITSGYKFEAKPKVFLKMCEDARNNPKNNYFLIVDEINRGLLGKIFGELIIGLEYRDDQEVELPYSNTALKVPKNFYLIGTMNSADRSIALVDYALRRRFFFIEMLPDNKILEKWLNENSKLSDVERSQVLKFFDEINQEIKTNPALGENFQIGHTYLFVKDRQELQQQWKYAIRPLLKEYVFNEQERLTRFDDAFTKNFGNLN